MLFHGVFSRLSMIESLFEWLMMIWWFTELSIDWEFLADFHHILCPFGLDFHFVALRCHQTWEIPGGIMGGLPGKSLKIIKTGGEIHGHDYQRGIWGIGESFWQIFPKIITDFYISTSLSAWTCGWGFIKKKKKHWIPLIDDDVHEEPNCHVWFCMILLSESKAVRI